MTGAAAIVAAVIALIACVYLRCTSVGHLGAVAARMGYHMRLRSPFTPGASWYIGFTPHGFTGFNGRPDFEVDGETLRKACAAARRALRAYGPVS